MKNYATLIAASALVVSIIGFVYSVQTSRNLEEVSAASQRAKLLTKINEVEIIAGKIAHSMKRMAIVCAQGAPEELETSNRIMNRALERENELRELRLAYRNYQEKVDFQVMEKRLSDVEVSRQHHQALLDAISKLDEETCK